MDDLEIYIKMKKIFIHPFTILLILLLFSGCSKESNPLLANEDFSGKLKITTEHSEYYFEEDSTNIIRLTASVFNTTSDTFYSNLGDWYGGIDPNILLMAEGTDGFFEKYIDADRWKQLRRGILIEGSKIIRLLPSRKYSLHALAYLDSNYSNENAKFRLRINYYKTNSQAQSDTLKDVSNIFYIRKN